MGRAHFGIPAHLVERVRTDTGIDAAVETGTFRGDSTVVLAEVDEPAVFWLDAHWSPWMPVDDRPKSPLRDELAAIADWPHAGRSVVLVDDVLFGLPG